MIVIPLQEHKMESIHAHNVLNLVNELGSDISTEQLTELMAATFGDAARYHTCRMQDLTADMLIQHFVKKGKLAAQGEQLSYRGCQCNHH